MATSRRCIRDAPLTAATGSQTDDDDDDDDDAVLRIWPRSRCNQTTQGAVPCVTSLPGC